MKMPIALKISQVEQTKKNKLYTHRMKNMYASVKFKSQLYVFSQIQTKKEDN